MRHVNNDSEEMKDEHIKKVEEEEEEERRYDIERPEVSRSLIESVDVNERE